MTSDEWLERLAHLDEDRLFTAALQLMRQIYDEVVEGDEEAVHGDLPSAIEDLCAGPWHEVDEQPLAISFVRDGVQAVELAPDSSGGGIIEAGSG